MNAFPRPFLALLYLPCLFFSHREAAPTRLRPAEPAASRASRANAAYGRVPLHFEANRGQAAASVDFLARGPAYAVFLRPGEAVFQLKNAASSATLRTRVIGADTSSRAEAMEELAGRVNYFIGSDPAKWRPDIPTYGRVRYREVYPGIDLVYYGNQRQLEYDFVIVPGADWRRIGMTFEGAEKTEIEPSTGDLLLHVGGETVRQAKPLAYQVISGARRMIEASYKMGKEGSVTFDVGEYEKDEPLVIDPVLVYSTFLGGTQGDSVSDIVVDSAGNTYLTGQTSSSDFPVANAIQAKRSGSQSDAFVTKINPSGSALVYSTYLGGSGSDVGNGIAVDSAGNAYIIGNTGSTNFPTANPIQGANANSNGTSDLFVTKLNPGGSALVYSTYLGGTAADNGEAIAVDSAGNAYLTGFTNSANFPIANAFRGANASILTRSDAFVTKINAGGSALIYSTYLGGAESDSARNIAVDSDGSAYVTGATGSSDFPVTANAIQGTFAGGFFDAFVAKFNPAGSALVYSTYLGGSDQDSGWGIALDSKKNAYVTGRTKSGNFPTVNSIQTHGGLDDVFVSKINPGGSALVYSTYIGGAFDDRVNEIAVDASGNAYITGDTTSTDFPLAAALQTEINGPSDAFVTKLNSTGSALVYSTYLGGSQSEVGQTIALDPDGNAYVAGSTGSPDFPTAAALQNTLAGDPDGFITKIIERSQLLNISTRMQVGTDPNQLIGGFIIDGSAPKKVIILATGPSLAAFGIPGVLADPVLQLFKGNTMIATNDNWKIPAQSEIEATKLQPKHDLESALVRTLAPGSYTAIVRGTNGTGVGTVQIYDLSQSANSKLANISSRGSVQPGDEKAMIAGFIIGGNGRDNPRVVVRALGPSLGAFGIPNALPDPTLVLKNANGTTLISNDDWQQSQQNAEINNRGLAPGNVHESALAISLPNGGYTAVVRGKGSAAGVAVVEVYHVE